jgi:hypothetical protein
VCPPEKDGANDKHLPINVRLVPDESLEIMVKDFNYKILAEQDRVVVSDRQQQQRAARFSAS